MDKNVWEYCINMFSALKTNVSSLFETKDQTELTRLKDECKNALTMLNTKNMETDKLDDIKLKIINFKTNYDKFIKFYNIASSKKKSSLYDEVKILKNSFDNLEKQFIPRYLDHLAPTLNGTVQEINKFKKDYTYYTLENYELKELGVFVSKTPNSRDDILSSRGYNTFKLLNGREINDPLDMYDRVKYYIEVKPEPVKPEDITLTLEDKTPTLEDITPGGKPRRTRRHKNKKRRSSKQRISKK